MSPFHSPAPWQVNSSGGARTIVARDRSVVAVVMGCGSAAPFEPGNAALIVAAPGMREALGILATLDVKKAVAFLLANHVELPHVAWSGKDEERSGAAYEWAGIHEDDARYIGPARDRLWTAVATIALAKSEQDGGAPEDGPVETGSGV